MTRSMITKTFAPRAGSKVFVIIGTRVPRRPGRSRRGWAPRGRHPRVIGLGRQRRDVGGAWTAAPL